MSEAEKDCQRFATMIQDLLYHGIVKEQDLMYPTLHEDYLDGIKNEN